jgi:hypothetical protein
MRAACGGAQNMENDRIEMVFEQLKRTGQCRSPSDFSRDWLRKNPAYYRGLKSSGRTASAEAQLNLAGRLRNIGMGFARSEHPVLREAGVTYLQMYGELIDGLLGAQSWEFLPD